MVVLFMWKSKMALAQKHKSQPAKGESIHPPRELLTLVLHFGGIHGGRFAYPRSRISRAGRASPSRGGHSSRQRRPPDRPRARPAGHGTRGARLPRIPGSARTIRHVCQARQQKLKLVYFPRSDFSAEILSPPVLTSGNQSPSAETNALHWGLKWSRS